MKTLKIIFMVCISINTINAQIDTLPSEKVLYHSLYLHFNEVEQYSVKEFEYTNKSEWLNYIPTLGIENDNGTLRPTISFSFATIFRFFADKRKRKAKIYVIRQNVRLKHELERLKLEQLLAKRKVKIRDLEQSKKLMITEHKILEIEKDLFKIESDKYARNKMLPSKFLSKKKQFLNVQKSFENKLYKLVIQESDIKLVELEIKNKAKYSKKNMQQNLSMSK